MGFHCKASKNSHLHSSILLFQIIKILLVLPKPTNSISFNFPNFAKNDSRINFQGDSFRNGSVIEVTRTDANLFTQLNGSIGRAVYAEAIQLWDATTGRKTDFDTQFSFIIDGHNAITSGDGMAFFLAPFGTILPPYSWGHALGLLNQDISLKPLAENQIVAVEFDSFRNHFDLNSDHVGINVNSVLSETTVLLANGSIRDGRKANAWVTYNSTTTNLSVILSYGENPVFNGSFTLNHVVDLSKVLPEQITVGFSASTGIVFEDHKLLSWQFNSTLELIHTRRDNKTSEGQADINGEGNADLSMNDAFENGTGPKRFSYKELINATSNFNEGEKLGEGGFGGVYKGFLSDLNLNIAVKRVSQGSKQGKKEYQSEVKIISQLRHRNLVRLIGWCHEKNELLLVYEFMPNRSLDRHLFRGESVLSWDVRYKIAFGLASGLLYLHEEWEQCVVHRDIKPSNVMLDSNFNAKLGDFGLARLVDHDLDSQTTMLAGTMGYIAPEYISTSKASKESDVYSFGIVALEIACGTRGVKVDWIWELYQSGKIIEAADERLNKDFDEKKMERLLVLGLWCAHPDPTTRPSIRQVNHLLNYDTSMSNLPAKLPSPVYDSDPKMRICKHAFVSASGDNSNSLTKGSPCKCSRCSDTSLSQTSTNPSASSSDLLLHS
ncbi:L-type lectin-domain containing receptor kinase IX.1-like [Papaver somniferum]|uniref:L-type lectin-domain containing receptor kinase IX.1-like n=1 Tax=Papaver somniferum TaxID=3469 RepID=UPI000E6FA526|nr:L-type lectin-domain containing receptor kinase IX.1-like [Papaver somniferum]